MTGADGSFPLGPAERQALVRSALSEDRALDDLTTLATIPADRSARATLRARQAGVIAGVPLAADVFTQLDPGVAVEVQAPDGSTVDAGQAVLTLDGPARALLSGERVALNFLQRLSGIATLTRRYVDAVSGTRAKILDTRKTTPGWRLLEKYAVRCGGGSNHRMDLAAAVLIKDNHLAAVGGVVALAVSRARSLAPAGTTVEVECDRIEQVDAALAAGADVILLDNMTPELMAECVRRVGGRALTEASGGVRLDAVRTVAALGVDWISVGALTHSPPALDLGLDFA